VVILSGSLGTTLELWEPQLAALTEEFRIIAYNHPGHGGSAVAPGRTVDALASDVLALLDELEIEQASFCGLSLGGAVGMALAASTPGRIERLAVACAAARFGDPQFWLDRAHRVRTEGLTAIAGVVVARWFTPAFAAASPEVPRRFVETLESTSVEGYARCCEALAAWDFDPRAGAGGTPTLVIAGGNDSVVSIAAAEYLANGFGAPLITLADTAHLANVESPDAFNEALLGHLRGRL
jgi:3-oxoadipate enol-lactonase